MFIALELQEQKKGILNRLRGKLTRPKVQLKHEKYEDADYAVIIAENNPKGPDWETIVETCGSYADRLLLPRDMDVPAHLKLQRPKFPQFELRLMINTAIEVIRRSKSPMYRRILGIYDPKARCVGFLPDLLSHYTCAKIVTNEVETYVKAGEWMMEQLGAPVIVSTELSVLQDCVFILAPELPQFPPHLRLVAPILTCEPKLPQCRCDFISHLRISPSEKLLRACPQHIEPHCFAAALHEFCGIEQPHMVAGSMLSGYRNANLPQVSYMIESAIATLQALKEK